MEDPDSGMALSRYHRTALMDVWLIRGQSSTKEILTPGGRRIFAFVAEVTRIENWLSSGRILTFETKLDES